MVYITYLHTARPLSALKVNMNRLSSVKIGVNKTITQWKHSSRWILNQLNDAHI